MKRPIIAFVLCVVFSVTCPDSLFAQSEQAKERDRFLFTLDEVAPESSDEVIDESELTLFLQFILKKQFPNSSLSDEDIEVKAEEQAIILLNGLNPNDSKADTTISVKNYKQFLKASLTVEPFINGTVESLLKYSATVSMGQRTRYSAIRRFVAPDSDDGTINEQELTAFFRRILKEKYQRPGAERPDKEINLISAAQAKKTMVEVAGAKAQIGVAQIGSFVGATLSKEPFDQAPAKGKLINLLPGPRERATKPSEGRQNDDGNNDKGKRLIDKLDHFLHLRQSFLNRNFVDRPATFTWSHKSGRDESLDPGEDQNSYEIVGALTLEPSFLNFTLLKNDSMTLTTQLIAVYEVNISSDSSDNRDRITHRTGFSSTLFRDDPDNAKKLFSGNNFDLTVDYITDADYDLELWGGTFQYTPNWQSGGIGRRISLYSEKSDPIVEFSWRPYIGLEFRHVSDDADDPSFDDEDNFTNIFARGEFELRFYEQLVFRAETEAFQELKSPQHTHWRLVLSSRYSLDKEDRVSVEISYEVGERSPEFLDVEISKISLGVKF